MKKLLIALCGTAIFFASCKEKAPSINLKDTVTVDTTYMLSTVPGTDAHNVLVEDFTGQGCSNCPAAHASLVRIEEQNPGRVNVIALYIQNFSQTVPPTGTADNHDFRTAVATDIGQTIYHGISVMPIAGIDRANLSGDKLQYQGSWGSSISSGIAQQDSLNLSITSSYNVADSVDTITATITYTQPVSGAHNLSIAVVEDGLVDKQDSTFAIIDNYTFTNVFRDMVTSAPNGDPILTSMPLKEAGRLYRHVYFYSTKGKNWNLANCKLVAFVNAASNDYVMQSVQTKMKP